MRNKDYLSWPSPLPDKCSISPIMILIFLVTRVVLFLRANQTLNDFLPMIKMFSSVSFHIEGWTMESGILENNDTSYEFKAQDAALTVDRKGGRA